MALKLELTARFQKEAKKYLKKYPSLKEELALLRNNLNKNPYLGTPIGLDCFKIRLAIQSKGKGKSGGARVIMHLHITETTIYLLTIYDKSEKENIKESELKDILKNL